jgi:hypothetical protein
MSPIPRASTHIHAQWAGLGWRIIVVESNHQSEVPTMSMANASIPVFEVGLNTLSALLDKA